MCDRAHLPAREPAAARGCECVVRKARRGWQRPRLGSCARGGHDGRVDRSQGSGSAEVAAPGQSRGGPAGVGAEQSVRDADDRAVANDGRIRMADPDQAAATAAGDRRKAGWAGLLSAGEFWRRSEREGDAAATPLATEWTTYSIALTDLPRAGLTRSARGLRSDERRRGVDRRRAGAGPVAARRGIQRADQERCHRQAAGPSRGG